MVKPGGIVAAVVVVVGMLASCVGESPSSVSGPGSPDGSTNDETKTGASDASAPDARSSEPAPDASASQDGGGARSIRCDGVMCQGTDVCCVTVSGEGNFESAACKPREECATTFLECDGAHECPDGMICCAKTHGGSYVWAASSCKTTCAPPDRQLCDDPSECASGCETVPAGIEPSGLRACAQ